MKIKKDVSITKDMLFENMIQYFRYHVVRENNKVCSFSVADFLLMNLYELIQVALLLKDKNVSHLQGTDPEVFRLGLAHIKLFIDNYYECLALTDVELATEKGLEVKVPMEPTKT